MKRSYGTCQGHPAHQWKNQASVPAPHSHSLLSTPASSMYPRIWHTVVPEEVLECDDSEYHDVQEDKRNADRSGRICTLCQIRGRGSQEHRNESRSVLWQNNQPRCPQPLGFTIRRCSQEFVMSYNMAHQPGRLGISWTRSDTSG